MVAGGLGRGVCVCDVRAICSCSGRGLEGGVGGYTGDRLAWPTFPVTLPTNCPKLFNAIRRALSEATRGKLPRDGMERIWTFLSMQIPSWTELN